MKKIIVKVFLIVMVLSLSGCVRTSVEVTPESMKGKGLLVAHITTSDYAGIKSIYSGHANINGENYLGALKEQYLAVPMEPGSYEFKDLNKSEGRRITTLPIKAKFTIKAGEVTNLGEVFLLFEKYPSKRFRIVHIDNNDDMHAYLRSKHSQIYQNLQKKKFNKADVKYIDGKLLDFVRRAAIAQTPAGKYNRQYYTGPLGSIGLSKKNKKGNIITIKWIDTGTYQYIKSCSHSKDVVACIVPHLTRGDRIFYAQGKRYKFYKKPSGFKKGRFVSLNNKDLYWVNNDLTIYHSKDNAKTWKETSQFRLKSKATNLPTGVFKSRNGLYLYSLHEDSTILYSKYGTESFRIVAPPINGKRVGMIVETKAGLYSGPERTSFSDSSLYFKARGKKQWVKRVIPTSRCRSMWLKDYNKDKITINCQTEKYNVSNQGKSMIKK